MAALDPPDPCCVLGNAQQPVRSSGSAQWMQVQPNDVGVQQPLLLLLFTPAFQGCLKAFQEDMKVPVCTQHGMAFAPHAEFELSQTENLDHHLCLMELLLDDWKVMRVDQLLTFQGLAAPVCQ